MVFTCGTCWKEFPAGWRARDQHLEATGHDEPDWECFDCDRWFGSEGAREQHMDALGHWNGQEPEFECDHCYECFTDDNEYHEHLRDDHHMCIECDRFFQNAHNLKMHLMSKIHRTDTIKCPFCGTERSTATGIVHHLERGSCPRAPLDREKLYQAVRLHDPKGIISKRLLESGHASEPALEATQKAWNPHSGEYECYLCHRGFRALAHLNQHLASPVHKQNLYHCPKRTCGKEFSTLAAMVSHLESESCGAMRFEQVQTSVRQITNPGRMIAGMS